MAASKKVGLRMAWPGDVFHAGPLRVDQDGVWDDSDKPVTLTQSQADELTGLAKANAVVLVDDSGPDVADATPVT